MKAHLSVDQGLGEGRSRCLDGRQGSVDGVDEGGLGVGEVDVGRVVGHRLLRLVERRIN